METLLSLRKRFNRLALPEEFYESFFSIGRRSQLGESSFSTARIVVSETPKSVDNPLSRSSFRCFEGRHESFAHLIKYFLRFFRKNVGSPACRRVERENVSERISSHAFVSRQLLNKSTVSFLCEQLVSKSFIITFQRDSIINMLGIEANQPTNDFHDSSLLTKGPFASPAPYFDEQLTQIRPRLCVLHKWPHYDGRCRVFRAYLRRTPLA